jgi:serine/alanine adding enzyme
MPFISRFLDRYNHIMTTYKILEQDSIDKTAWDDYVDSHEYGAVFHSSFLYKVFTKTNDFKPFALFAVDMDNQIRAMLQGFIQIVKPGFLASLSTRSVLLKSPIYSDLGALKVLLKGLLKYVQEKAIYTEIRNHWIDTDSRQIYTELGFHYLGHLNYTVNCSDSDKAWLALSESKRRQLKKALGSGVEILDTLSLEQFTQFYDILRELYAKKVRKPLPSYDFFRALYDSSQSNPDRVKFFLVGFCEKIIGGICCPVSGKKAIHEFYVAGLDAEYKELYPSSLATWAAIDYAAKNGIAVFDFMGAGKPDENYGVREFKSRFGGTLLETGRYRYVNSPGRMRIAETGFKLLRKIKAGL